jgi:peptide/nickel transport system permease protein
MLRFLRRRLLTLIPLFLGITVISFAVMHLAPGGPVSLLSDLNPKMTADARARLEAYYGLDKPLVVQYATWLGRFVRLDFGSSFAPDGRPVLDKIAETIPITFLIESLSLLFILLVAIPLGVASAAYRGSAFDRTSTVIVFVGFAMPSFWLALLLMMFFGIQLGWLPVSGIQSLNHASLGAFDRFVDSARHLVLPVFVSAFTGLAGMSRYMRGNMLEVLRQEYITAARAKGLSNRRVLYRHAMRNALLPVITILGLSLPGLIGGSVIFEQIYAIPGAGRLFYQAVFSRDYPLVMGILSIGAMLTLLGNLLADVGYALVDPRIRAGGGER